MRGHDIIVVGASAGGVQALIELVSRLPADLPAAVFVVLHMAARAPNILPTILARHATMEVVPARDGDAICPGRIYVACADFHLILEPGKIRLNHGPKQHHTRPAVDPLFQSAAEVYGPRVVGVVLTGAGANGARGMLAIKQRGGVAMIQDPEEALWPAMPSSTQKVVGIDHVLPVAELARVLADLARDPVDGVGASTQEVAALSREAIASPGFLLACPECGDNLILLEPGTLRVFGCPIGHTFGGEELLEEQSDELDSALCRVYRIARQQALLAEWLAVTGSSGGDLEGARQLDLRRKRAHHTAAVVFEWLHSTGREAS